MERLDGELRTVRDALRDERRKRAGLEADRVTGATPAIPTADPDALAEHLDLLAVMAAAAGPEVSELDISGRATQPCRLAFPASLLPDSAEAIDWLCAAGRAEVLIDGYNLGFLLRDVTEPGPARAVALEVTNRLALTCPEADLVVVFDSSADLDDASTSGSGAYSVVYTGGGTADDEIVARVGECAVVVTNDRELRERAEAAGAIALWSDALAAWSRRR